MPVLLLASRQQSRTAAPPFPSGPLVFAARIMRLDTRNSSHRPGFCSNCAPNGEAEHAYGRNHLLAALARCALESTSMHALPAGWVLHKSVHDQQQSTVRICSELQFPGSARILSRPQLPYPTASTKVREREPVHISSKLKHRLSLYRINVGIVIAASLPGSEEA